MQEAIIKGYNLAGIKALVAGLKAYHEKNLIFKKTKGTKNCYEIIFPAGGLVEDLLIFLNYKEPDKWFPKPCTMFHWQGDSRFGGVNILLREKVLVLFGEEGVNIDFLCKN